METRDRQPLIKNFREPVDLLFSQISKFSKSLEIITILGGIAISVSGEPQTGITAAFIGTITGATNLWLDKRVSYSTWIEVMDPNIIRDLQQADKRKWPEDVLFDGDTQKIYMRIK